MKSIFEILGRAIVCLLVLVVGTIAIVTAATGLSDLIREFSLGPAMQVLGFLLVVAPLATFYAWIFRLCCWRGEE